MPRPLNVGLLTGVAKAMGLLILIAVNTELAVADTTRLDFPPPKPTVSEPEPSIEEFVGSQACADCHREQYDRWKQSTHGRAGGVPTADTVISRFDGTTLRFKDARVTLTADDDGEYLVEVREDGRAAKTYRVDAVVGGGHMIGGGTQASFSRFPDGSWRLLPFDYSKHSDTWFCSTPRRGWLPITKEMSISECQDWPIQWTKGFIGIGCQNCHGSQLSIRYSPDTYRYDTTHKSFSINCESCHGPGKEHIERVRSESLNELSDVGMRSLSLLTKDESLQTCFQCHAQKGPFRYDYLPGKRFDEYFALSVPLLGSLYPDGRVDGFAYQGNHVYSDCYLSGSMTCVDCHDPHSQGYRDINGVALQGRFDNQQCLACHASKAMAPEAHSHHKPASPGNRCTSCHMPFLQHRSVGNEIRFERSDHTIPIPRPAFDQALGIENACQKCHQDRSIEWQQAKVEQWYGQLKPHKPIVDTLFKLRSSPDEAAIEERLLEGRDTHPAALVQILGIWMDTFLRPDLPRLEPRIVERLKQLSRHENIDLRSTALAILHFTLGDEPKTRAFLGHQLAGLGNHDTAVRRRWTTILWLMGKRYEAKQEFRNTLAVYNKALEIQPDDIDVHSGLGDYYFERARDLTQALYHYRKVLELGPYNAVNHATIEYKLGRIHHNGDDTDRALASYRKAIDIIPENSPALRDFCAAYDELTTAQTVADSAKRKCLGASN